MFLLRVVNLFSQIKEELSNVEWIKRSEVLYLSLMMLLVVFLFLVLFSFADYLSIKVVDFILR